MRKSGFLIGRMDSGRPQFMRAVAALFNPRVPSLIACERYLGLFRKSESRPVRIPVVHTAVFAPPGAGKSTGLAIPHLLTCRDSCVVVDVKGELARETARARRAMGHRVVLLDPFKVLTRTPDTFNPLDFIARDSGTVIDDCIALAESLVLRTGQEREPHWNDSAEMWIASMAAFLVNEVSDGSGSLQALKTLLTDPKYMQLAIGKMSQSDAWNGILSRLGHALTHFKDRELGSVLTTTNRHLRFLDTLPVAESTQKSSFNPADLTKGKVTVYLLLPSEYLRSHAALLRMWIGSMLRACVKGGPSTREVHFVIDEAAALGSMDALTDALAQYRGYGVRLQLYYQSVGQLKSCWPEGQDQTVLSNCTQVYFAVNDNQTAEYVSNRLGEFTQVVTSGGRSGGTSRQTNDQGPHSYSYSSNWSENWQQAGRRLLKPEEVMALPERTALTFLQGVPPIRTRIVRHFEDPHLGGQPGRRFQAVRASFDAFLLLAATGLAALALTQIAGDERPQSGGTRPSRSAEPFTSDYWQMR